MSLQSFIAAYIDNNNNPTPAGYAIEAQIKQAYVEVGTKARKLKRNKQSGRHTAALYALQGGRMLVERRAVNGSYKAGAVQVYPRCAYCNDRCSSSNPDQLEHALPVHALHNSALRAAAGVTSHAAGLKVGGGNVLVSCKACNMYTKGNRGLHGLVQSTPPALRRDMLARVYRVLTASDAGATHDIRRVSGDTYELVSPPAAVI
jgi:hypothetical protein